MRTLIARLATLVAVATIAAAVMEAQPSTLMLAAGLVVAAAAITIVALHAAGMGSVELVIGARSHTHRESLSSLAAPRHPNTAGRPRTRAPATAASLEAVA
jgi:hypothetical protein